MPIVPLSTDEPIGLGSIHNKNASLAISSSGDQPEISGSNAGD